MNYLKRVKMSNLQSWGLDEGTTIEFTSGLNILVAENSVGKSVLIKVLEHIVQEAKRTKDECRQIITFGKDKGEVSFEFSDGTFYVIEIYVGMCRYYMQKGQFTSRNSEVVRQHLFKDLSLIIEPNSGFVANIIKADQGKFLVSTDSKSNEKLLSTITVNSDMEKIISTCNERITILNGANLRINGRMRVISNRLEGVEFSDTEAMEDSIEIETNLLNMIENTYYLSALLSPIKEVEDRKYIEDLKLFTELKNLNKITEEIKAYEKPPIEERNLMLNLRELYKTVDSLGEPVEEINPLEIDSLRVLQKMNELVKEVDDNPKPQVNPIEREVLKALSDLNMVEDFEIKTFSVNKKDLKTNQILSDLEKTLIPTVKIANSLERLNGEIKELTEEYTGIIEEQKITGYECPICGSVGLLKEKSTHFLQELGILEVTANE